MKFISFTLNNKSSELSAWLRDKPWKWRRMFEKRRRRMKLFMNMLLKIHEDVEVRSERGRERIKKEDKIKCQV